MDNIYRRQKNISKVDYLFLVIYMCIVYLQVIFRKIFPSVQKSLDNEIVLITGAANGLGKETAMFLAKNNRGAILVLWDIDEEGNRALKHFAEEFGAKAYAYTVNVADRFEVENVAAKVRAEVGDVTILINTARMINSGPFLTLPDEVLEDTVHINLLSEFWMIRTFLPKMMEKNQGQVVSILSPCSFMGIKQCSVFTATEFARRGYLNAFCKEIREYNAKTDKIVFTSVIPWFVTRKRTNSITPKYRYELFRRLIGQVKHREAASQIVTGIRRNQETVYIPAYLEPLVTLSNFIPRRIRQKLEDVIFEDFGNTSSTSERELGHITQELILNPAFLQ